MCRPFNVPGSKFPRKEAVDCELVYSISTASWVTGNLRKAEDTHIDIKEILHVKCAPEGTQRTPQWHPESQSHLTILASLCCHMRLKLKSKSPNKTTGQWE